MAKKTLNQVKLGVFVMAGIAFLVLLLYVIGKNQNMFGDTFLLKARFENVHGLMKGNNIRFAGIDAGTVKDVEVLNDTTIEVNLLVKTGMQKFIHKNATVNIATDGLMGDKIINIEPSREVAPLVAEGDILFATEGTDTDAMLRMLNKTNRDIAIVASELKKTIQRVNQSKALWEVLDDPSLPANLRYSLGKIKTTADNLNSTIIDLNTIVANVKDGKGSLGKIIRDTAIAMDIDEAIQKLKGVGVSADSLAGKINSFISTVDYQINNGTGTVNALLNDKQIREQLNMSMENIEKGTKSFQENMEALKSNILFRGYFKKLEKQKKAEMAKNY
jgi:phospholipid/cholesterol/gamma-HCH transport system substrate-binding protein